MARKTKQQKGDAAASQNSSSGPSSKAKQLESPLWTALKHEDEEELLRLLFDQVEDVESGELRWVQKPTARKAVGQPNAKKMLPLSYAVSEGLPRSLVEALLRAGAAVNKRDETAEQSTALHAACWNEDGEAVDVLLRAGADPRVLDGDGRTALHVLATSNATSLMLAILDRVGHTPAGESDEGQDAADGRAAPVSSAVLQVDPIELLGVADKAQGATVLHLALSESTYNFGVAQALCEYLESVQESKVGAVARLVSTRTTEAGDSPLHALVGAANAEDAIVEALVRRLLALGADPLARNAAGQSIVEVAIASRPGCSSKAGVQLYETLLAPVFAKEEGACFLTEKNKSGHAVIHVALAAANGGAVKALCSVVPATQAKALLGDAVTADGISVVELLATSAGSVEAANALIAAGAVARDAYESLRQSHEALQAQQNAEREREAEAQDGEEDEKDDDDGGDDEEGKVGATAAEAGSAALANLKRRHGAAGGGGGGGLSRVQQARRARAATAVQRKQPSSGHEGSSGGGGGGLFGGGELSAPVKVVGVLLLLSVFVSAYTMLFGMEDASAQGL